MSDPDAVDDVESQFEEEQPEPVIEIPSNYKEPWSPKKKMAFAALLITAVVLVIAVPVAISKNSSKTTARLIYSGF